MAMRRPPNAPDRNEPMLLAARYNDAECEEHGLEATAEKYGVNPKTLMYVAEQRALRQIILRKSGERNVSAILGMAVRLTDEERAELAWLTASYMDAIMLGWRARELTNEEDN